MVCLSLLASKLHEEKIFFSSFVHLSISESCLAHSRYSMNVCKGPDTMNGRMFMVLVEGAWLLLCDKRCFWVSLFRGWQTFSGRGQMEIFSALWVILSLLHLLNWAMVVQREPETIHQWMSMANFQTWPLSHSLLTQLYSHFWKPHQVRILQRNCWSSFVNSRYKVLGSKGQGSWGNCLFLLRLEGVLYLDLYENIKGFVDNRKQVKHCNN